MKKVSIRIKFSLIVGLCVLLFTASISAIDVFIIRHDMGNVITTIESNINSIEESDEERRSESMELYSAPSNSSNNQMFNNTLSPQKEDRVPLENPSVSSYRDALSIFNEAADEAIGKFAIASISMGILGFIVAYFLSGFLLKPFKRLSQDIASVNESSLDKLLFIDNPNDEIGQIKKSFNNLLVRINTINERQLNFTSNVAHELKTPLSVMKIYPETLDEDSSIEDYKSVIAIEEKNIDRMIELVNDLLEYSKTIDIKAEKVKVKDLIEINLDALKPLIEEKAINVYEDIEDLEIITGKDLFSRIIYNLLSNAIRYNKDKGSIYIELKGKELSIRDTGIGMSEDELERIFEPLYCVDKSRSRELGGTGLGLSIVKKSCDILNYKIEVGSKLGHGSIFTIKL